MKDTKEKITIFEVIIALLAIYGAMQLAKVVAPYIVDIIL